MRKISLALASFWVVAALCFGHIIWLQSIDIGGMSYFGHVGMGSGAFVEVILALGSVALSVLLYSYAFSTSRDGTAIAFLSLTVAGLTFYTYFRLYAPALSRFAYISLFTFPREQYNWFPIAAVVLGSVTATVVSQREQS